MSFEKVLDVRIFGVTLQNADVYLPVGDSSGDTFTSMVNPLRGTMLWDSCMYVMRGISVNGGATGGSYTVTVMTNAVTGYTGLPIASVTLGPLSKGTLALTNLHNSPSSPLPTHLFIDQTAAGEVSFQVHAIAKQYRGVLSTQGSGSAERVIMGTMLRGASFAGGRFKDGRGMDVDATLAVGTSCTDLGLGKMRLWDSAFYWGINGNSVAGTHDVDIIGTVGGVTFSIASTGIAGALDVAGEKLAVASNFGGQSPNPTAIIWTEVGAGGVSDARVVVLAKSGRGSMGKQ